MSKDNTYKGIYAMHKYWGKKPFHEISRFIEKYSEPGEVVLDSFCGSGITLIEAAKLKRKCVGVDLNPIAIKIAEVSLTAVDIEELHKAFDRIKEKLKSVIYSMYTVEEDGKKALVTHTIWKDGTPIEVWYETEQKKKTIREGREIDLKMAEHPSVEAKWYPKSLMYENSRINVGENQRVCDLFTKRALTGLSLLAEEIRNIEDKKIRNILELTLSGTLSQASRLVFVIRDRKKNGKTSGRAEVGSWVVGYWVPEEHFEINVWNCFENRFRRILKGEEEINSIFKSKEKDSDDIDVSLFQCSATNLPLEDNSVDYVFIDPPHSNRILYMEMSFMWNAWLKLDSDLKWEDEIVVSEAKERKKNSENYNTLLDQAFSEIHRVLKPDRYFSLAFNCLKDDIWLDILNLFVRYGFEISDIVPLEYSATSVVQDNRKNALKTDFVLTFRNTDHGQQKIIFKEDKEILKNKIEEIFHKNPNSQTYYIINKLFEETIPQGCIFRVSDIVKQCAAREEH